MALEDRIPDWSSQKVQQIVRALVTPYLFYKGMTELSQNLLILKEINHWMHGREEPNGAILISPLIGVLHLSEDAGFW